MTITDFLIARIAEDEAAAKAAIPGPWAASREGGAHGIEAGFTGYASDPGPLTFYAESGWEEEAEHIARHDPARVLAECAAKRAIVAQAQYWGEPKDHAVDEIGIQVELSNALRHLAAVYADHPDYRQEWAV